MARKSNTLFFLFFYAALALGLTLLHLYKVDLRSAKSQAALHNEIIAGIAQKPYNARILQPLLVDSFVSFCSSLKIPVAFDPFTGGYAILRFLALFATFSLTAQIYNFFAKPPAGLIGVLLLAALYPLTFLFYYYQPTSVLDLAFFAGGIYLIINKRSFLLLALVLFLATLNRNTSVFIIAFYALWLVPGKWESPISAIRGMSGPAALFLLWFITMRLINATFPGYGWVLTVRQVVSYNLTEPRVWVFSLLLLWPVLASIVYAWKETSPRHHLLILWLLPYCLVHFLMARCDEVRSWLPLYIVFSPFLAVSISKLTISPADRAAPSETA